jgi:hypothetical protein
MTLRPDPIEEDSDLPKGPPVPPGELPYIPDLNYDPTGSQICEEEDKKMLFYKSVDFCPLLYAQFNKDDIIAVNSRRKYICTDEISNYLNIPRDGTLIPKKVLTFNIDNENHDDFDLNYAKVSLTGYYIRPRGGRFEGGQNFLSQSIHTIEFYPVWMLENTIEFVEVVTNSMTINLAAINTTVESGQCGADIYASQINIPTPTFNHNFLQFDYLGFNYFGKAFISRHELVLITQFSDYLGITGARVSSGNFVSEVLDSNGETIDLDGCNKNYFTYRLVGFNIIDCDLPDGVLAFNKSNKLKKGYNSETPNETWTTPCPPSWKPQP